MATFKQGILGGFSGKVGTVVGSVWKGIFTMRALAASVTNPRTPAQLEQRAKFSTVVKFLQTMTAFLRIGFKSQAIQMTAFNAAFKYNFDNALIGTYPTYEIDYAKAKLSKGSLPGALNPTAASTVEGELDLTWDNNSTEAGASATDKVMIVVYSAVKQLAVTVEGGNTRVSGSQTLTLPTSFIGETVQVYIGFQDANGAKVSDSQYIHSVIVA